MRYPLILALLCASTAPAATIVMTDSTVTTIPDGSSSGVGRTLSINGGSDIVTSVEVDISISANGASPAFLGDIYLYLTNGSSLSVLANRAGRSISSPSGYSDNQSMSLTFSNSGANDFHNYRVPLTGSNAVALVGTLTGIWQPDGRSADPSVVLDTSLRNASLSVFNGAPATGNWSLFAADLSTGAVHQINSWTLRLQTVPEPGISSVAVLTVCGALLRRRRA